MDATPIPRLAGQQPEYIENQLQAFIERRRDNKYMYNVSHVLSPAMRTALAKHFSGTQSQTLGRRSKGTRGRREKNLRGRTSQKLTCLHALPVTVQTLKATGEFPRLAGQLNDYIFNKLVNWSKERGQDPAKPDTSAIMQPIAHNLTKAQIAAVAAYLNYLE